MGVFGLKLIHKAELKAREDRVAEMKWALERMESELHYWRDRADEERNRADRLNDVVMQQNGLPEVTELRVREGKEKIEQGRAELEKRQEELSEMFSDSLDQSDDLNWIDPDLRAAAEGWMEQAKVAREARKEEKA